MTMTKLDLLDVPHKKISKNDNFSAHNISRPTDRTWARSAIMPKNSPPVIDTRAQASSETKLHPPKGRELYMKFLRGAKFVEIFHISCCP